MAIATTVENLVAFIMKEDYAIIVDCIDRIGVRGLSKVTLFMNSGDMMTL